MHIDVVAFLALAVSNAFAQSAPVLDDAIRNANRVAVARELLASYAVCWAARGLNTAYYSSPFSGVIDNRYAWVPAFAEYLKQNYDYKGFVSCKTKLHSLPEAQAYLRTLIDNSRGSRLSDGSSQNYVETGWTYTRTATAMDFLYR
jgi:hypothetical protein